MVGFFHVCDALPHRKLLHSSCSSISSTRFGIEYTIFVPFATKYPFIWLFECLPLRFWDLRYHHEWNVNGNTLGMLLKVQELLHHLDLSTMAHRRPTDQLENGVLNVTVIIYVYQTDHSH